MTLRRGGVAGTRLCLGLLLVAGAATVLVGSPAYAHVELVSSTPADGAAVSTAPEQVVLRFSEDVRAPAYVVVSGPDGSRLDDGPAQVVDATVSQALAPMTEPGEYSVAYRVVSVDGHPVTGEMSFTLTGAGRTTVPPPTSDTAIAPTLPTGAAHEHPTSGGSHWEHVIPLVGVAIAGLVVLVNHRRRRRIGAAQATSSPPT